MQKLFPSLILVSSFLLFAACGDGDLGVQDGGGKAPGAGGTGSGGIPGTGGGISGTGGGISGTGGGSPGAGGIPGFGGSAVGTGGSVPGSGGISGSGGILGSGGSLLGAGGSSGLGGTGSGGQTGIDAGMQLDGSVGAGGNGLIEAAAPDRPERRDAPATCTGPLKDRWGVCPATFDGHPETFGCRFGVSGFVRAAVIDGRQVIEWSSFPTMMQCVYASVNEGAALVGEIDIADSLLFCDRTSYSQAFGSVPDCVAQSCDLADLCTLSSCTCPPDAGAADAGPDAAE